MPKGIREPLQELEGGKGFGGMGGAGGGGGRRLTFDERMAENAKNAANKNYMPGLATAMAGPVLGGVGSIVGGKVLGDMQNERKENERKEKAEREAAAELKRESRGMKKGGMTASKRADGIAQRGKTRGKMR